MGRMVLILGGARSGKSDHAQQLAESRPGPVLFIATGQPLDDEMKKRILAHRQRRPQHWQTLELPTGVGKYVREHAGSAGVVLLDCLTLLVSNSMLDAGEEPAEPDEPAARSAVQQEIEHLTRTIRESNS
jgi:adenosylcobinamide kinase / adenosylcobinamide-phosphate guanylyltransferase